MGTSRPWFALATLVAAGLMLASYVASQGRGVGVPGWGVHNIKPPWPVFMVSMIGATEDDRPVFRVTSYKGVIQNCAYVTRPEAARSVSGLRCTSPP